MSEKYADEPFERIYTLINDNQMPPDYKHTTTGRTALGIAGERGCPSDIIKLLILGADPSLKDNQQKTALDYANEKENKLCGDALDYYSKKQELRTRTLSAYYSSQDSDHIDHDLLVHVITYIHLQNPTDQSILVFLPGYHDICTQQRKIEAKLKNNNYEIFVLHSAVRNERVFERLPREVRKIILSTNIAETSITIEDVVGSMYLNSSTIQMMLQCT